MSQTKVVAKIKTNILCSGTFFFRKSCRVVENVENCGTAGETTDNQMAHANCMLGTQGYKYTHRLCNTHCYSTAITVTRTLLNVTLYIACLADTLQHFGRVCCLH